MDNEKKELDVGELNRELQTELDKMWGSQENEPQTLDKSHHRNHRKSHKNSKKEKKEKKEKGRLTPFKICIVILCMLILMLGSVVSAFFYMRAKGERALQTEKVKVETTTPEDVEVEEDGKYIIYNGKRYCYNEDVINILCMGLDRSLNETSEDNIGANGQADVLVLAALDAQTGRFSLINISRETMVDVKKYNVNGQYLGTEEMQICLSYAYGDGKETSCLNTIDSVSRLMYGTPIHAYAAIDLDSISILNDAVGGVTLTLMEDFSRWDSAMVKGATITLDGRQAYRYVRSRDVYNLESNNLRMNRQKQYLMAFLQKALAAAKEDMNVPLALYQTASDYMVTDIGTSEVTYLASLVLEHGISDGAMKTVPGEVIQGEVHAEFIPDDQGLYELIIDVFYKEVTE